MADAVVEGKALLTVASLSGMSLIFSEGIATTLISNCCVPSQPYLSAAVTVTVYSPVVVPTLPLMTPLDRMILTFPGWLEIE